MQNKMTEAEQYVVRIALDRGETLEENSLANDWNEGWIGYRHPFDFDVFIYRIKGQKSRADLTKNQVRRFEHARGGFTYRKGGYGSQLIAFEIEPTGTAYEVFEDGSRGIRKSLSLDECLVHVRRADWKEVTPPTPTMKQKPTQTLYTEALTQQQMDALYALASTTTIDIRNKNVRLENYPRFILQQPRYADKVSTNRGDDEYTDIGARLVSYSEMVEAILTYVEVKPPVRQITVDGKTLTPKPNGDVYISCGTTIPRADVDELYRQRAQVMKIR